MKIIFWASSFLTRYEKKNMGGVGLFLFQFFSPLTSRQAAGNSVFQILKGKEFLLSCFFGPVWPQTLK